MVSSSRSVVRFCVLSMLLVLASGDLLDPLWEEICEDVNCGKGSCKSGSGYKFKYICECDSGWKRTRNDTDDDDLKFLPCVIPNCTLDYSCMPAAAPAPSNPHNESVFDACYWSYCGEGTCTKNKSSSYKYTCECSPGYSNLLNISVYPCYSQCALGSDCSSLGATLSSSETASPSDNQGSSNLKGKFRWVVTTVVVVVTLLALLRK